MPLMLDSFLLIIPFIVEFAKNNNINMSQLLEEALLNLYFQKKALLGPGPGFEPGLGDPQPHNRQFWQNAFIQIQNPAYGTENHFSRKLLMKATNSERSGNTEYVITKEHLKLLYLELKSKNVQEHHLKFVKRSINRFLSHIRSYGEYYAFTVEELISYLQKLQNEYNPTTYRKQLTYLKKLFRIAQIPLENYLKTKRTIGVDRTIVTVADIKNLINTVKMLRQKGDLNEKIQDRLIVALLLMATSGIRTYELTKLKVKDIDIKNMTIRITEDVSKTSEARVTFFTREVQKLLKNYVQKYDIGPEDPIVTYFALEKPFLKKKELKEQSLRPKHMRKFFSQEWDRRNGNTTVKKLLMGHSIRQDINILHYSHHTEKELKEIYDKVLGNLRFTV
ncbi:MAG: hypothetical protein DRP02_14230 [Candidatus Gerdarchaeota archaeon]|nr:MAG: hypothetical protein DRP02_14230 [Candidatus Gerdarchaeota archaeon]